jgi:glycosyltransferase involved in cell wall biosynthesis
MSDRPSVCIMIPAYNQEDFIGKAIESALRQDYSNIEIIVADDNSTDATAALMTSFLGHPSVRYKKNDVNLGRVANYRKCLYEYAKADWVINLDADDYFTNDQYISQAMQAIQTAGIDNILFYQGVNYLKNELGQKLLEPQIKSNEICITARDYFLGFFERDSFSHMSTLYHRQSAIESNFYSRDIISADIFSILQLCLKNSIKKVIVGKNISGVWNQHNGSASKTLNPKMHWNNWNHYIKLYALAVKKGFRKPHCFKWLMRGSFIYVRSYFYKFIRGL